MSIQNCVITFERINGVYYSGELVKGRINLTIQGTINVRELFLNITGDAECRWGESPSSGRNKGTIFLTGKEVYFQTTSNLLNSVNALQGGFVTLGSGVHTFDFQFQLLTSLPTSYESAFGRIRYTAMVTIRQANNAAADQAYAVNFTVLSSLDLNLYPEIMAPVKKDIIRNISTLFSTSGLVKVLFEMPRTGYVPGQQIPIKCLINNCSKSQIFEVKLYLLKIIEYSANFPFNSRRREVMKLARSASGSIRKGEQYGLNVNLSIPSVPPSTFPLISIISISYAAKLKLVMGGLNANIEVEIPITIGTIPIMSQVPGFVVPSESSPNPPLFARNNIPQPMTATEQPPAYGAGLPTYEEAVSYGTQIGFVQQEQQQSSSFTPKYPVFRE